MKPRNSGVLQHEVAEIQSAEHVSSFLAHVEFVNDGTVLENLQIELVTRGTAPRGNLVRNRNTLRGRLVRIARRRRRRRRLGFCWVARRRHWSGGVWWIRVYGGRGSHWIRHCDSLQQREMLKWRCWRRRRRNKVFWVMNIEKIN